MRGWLPILAWVGIALLAAASFLPWLENQGPIRSIFALIPVNTSIQDISAFAAGLALISAGVSALLFLIRAYVLLRSVVVFLAVLTLFALGLSCCFKGFNPPALGVASAAAGLILISISANLLARERHSARIHVGAGVRVAGAVLAIVVAISFLVVVFTAPFLSVSYIALFWLGPPLLIGGIHYLVATVVSRPTSNHAGPGISE